MRQMPRPPDQRSVSPPATLGKQPAPPDWLRPTGVSKGVWDYVRSRTIAEHFDEHVERSAWATLDVDLVKSLVEQCKHPVVVDFGCGTGRSLDSIGDDSAIRWIGIDLSVAMLHQATLRIRKKPRPGGKYALRANLVELDGVGSSVADIGICLFSTFGMISDRENRQKFLASVHRVLKPDGIFVLHAHNLWYNARFPGGWRWCLYSLTKSVVGRCEFGDRFADFQDARNLKLRHFRFRELARVLRKGGFRIETVWRLGNQLKPGYRPWHVLSTAGWLLVCRRQ